MISSPQKRHRTATAILLISGFLLLVAGIVKASLERSITDNGHLMTDAWFQVTLLDAYVGFGIFYGWVFFRENSLLSRVLWFVLIMTLGNVATISYLLMQIYSRNAERKLFN